MIIVTGAAGFIGSCMVNKLNHKGKKDIVVADDFSNIAKMKNLLNKTYRLQVHRDELIAWIKEHHKEVSHILHIGARTDTTEFNIEIFNKLNLNYSKEIWNACTKYKIPLIYASSAATYGMGELGYVDDHNIITKLKPLNPYGTSKNDFDKWVLQQKETPPVWFGLKFFNVYGPNEYHKGRMASVIFHAHDQINVTGRVKLFKSHRPDFEDGKQLRDFIYVKDVISVIHFLMGQTTGSGIYNLGTGKARTFLDLVTATFKAMNTVPQIDFIDTPIDIRDKYQYFTEANMQKLIHLGYDKKFFTLEQGIHDYVGNYLIPGLHY